MGGDTFCDPHLALPKLFTTFLRPANDMAVIHTSWHNDLPSGTVLPDIDTWLTANRLKPISFITSLGLRYHCLFSLLEAIKQLEEQVIEQAFIVGVLFIALWGFM